MKIKLQTYTQLTKIDKLKMTTLIKVKLKVSDGHTNIDKYKGVTAHKILQNIITEQKFKIGRTILTCKVFKIIGLIYVF